MNSINRNLVFNTAQRNKWKGETLTRRRKFRRMISLAHHVTFFLGKKFPSSIPLVFVLGFPKSGTTWICQLLSDYLGIPFPQHTILPVGFASVVHGHEVVTKKYPLGVYIVRDGRDVIVSSFHHLKNECQAGGALKKHRKFFSSVDLDAPLRDTLPSFIQHLIDHPLHHKIGWGKHVSTFFDAGNENFQLVRFEDLIADTSTALSDLMHRLSGEETCPARINETVTRFSFQRQSGNGKGTEGSFLRKGQSGDWKNHFNRESAELFDQHYGKALIDAGYESDSTWVEQF